MYWELYFNHLSYLKPDWSPRDHQLKHYRDSLHLQRQKNVIYFEIGLVLSYFLSLNQRRLISSLEVVWNFQVELISILEQHNSYHSSYLPSALIHHYYFAMDESSSFENSLQMFSCYYQSIESSRRLDSISWCNKSIFHCSRLYLPSKGLEYLCLMDFWEIWGV